MTRGFTLTPNTASTPPDLDLSTRCVDTLAVPRDAMVVALRTRRTKWRGDFRCGVSYEIFELGVSESDLKLILEAEITDTLSRVTGILVETVTAVRVPATRVWRVRVEARAAQTGQAIDLNIPSLLAL